MKISVKAILIGVLAAFFFSLTFIFNEIIANKNGFWLWSASLRFLWMLPMMAVILVPLGGSFKHVKQAISRQPVSWWVWSHFCFVLFYVPLCLASAYLPGWLVASVWQSTIVCGVLTTPLLNLGVKGKTSRPKVPFPWQSLPWMGLILAGVLMTVMQYMGTIHITGHIYLALLAILVGAICYPLGNRQVMMIAPKTSGIERIWGMLICTTPTWLLLAGISFVVNGTPSSKTVMATFLVALSSGVIATALFFHATSMVFKNIKSLAKVEATQAMELVFSIILSVIVLHHPFSFGWQFWGVLVIIVGIVGISLRD
ncbi:MULTISPECIES: multidrug resistance efflux transporter family protein [Leuconostoc]|jgi:drug/metabolite transporter (DMT)-like permease|uniref:Multidrug resistance efflux transporter family protein n=1 Tax=Leuconostoc pseudomesenteroides TaxID=33968 RepID=A0ABT6HEB6_LEUPS|nr:MULTISPECIES: multidrug resistance efflux transporter family protein [Leuconostoc]MCC8440544.1 multidrug resistance efflux transporter family protein [Leuconostoc pseudomesenteroides]MDG9734175.1 multidrug resistance efflux transporter family protein [Leuconostoc pseudomesenteroides]MDN2451949.1 multidrug resistance efflux transporter family protein [Leuconostoc sp. UCMA20149]NKZ36470.1 multidrug resistance efflux transporter family protein [Leuconostoc pseudomesenteroides]QQB27356.1 multid